ncbi:hypothetical protein ECC02_006550 [Trypanosoma cruzi]|uniref:Uncharacterized protein n=1 Tax=Trypanosoma cruzi TaxID=5693 RepID=A0A7J6Y1B2_TRYCR|nr:hypothetical protein ECC02_006550 [Trypanosoma cruzi]
MPRINSMILPLTASLSGTPSSVTDAGGDEEEFAICGFRMIEHVFSIPFCSFNVFTSSFSGNSVSTSVVVCSWPGRTSSVNNSSSCSSKTVSDSTHCEELTVELLCICSSKATVFRNVPIFGSGGGVSDFCFSVAGWNPCGGHEAVDKTDCSGESDGVVMHGAVNTDGVVGREQKRRSRTLRRAALNSGSSLSSMSFRFKDFRMTCFFFNSESVMSITDDCTERDAFASCRLRAAGASDFLLEFPLPRLLPPCNNFS